MAVILRNGGSQSPDRWLREPQNNHGVSLKGIQQYEQRVKDISKAYISNLLALAKTLGCQVEDIVEYEIRDAEE